MRITPLILVAALVAAACGGGDDDSESTSADTSPPQSETTELQPADVPADGEEPEAQPEPSDDEPAEADQMEDGPTDVTSPDGQLTLSMPPGSPEITIEAVDLELGPDILTLAAYDLGPDGTTFEAPIQARFVPDTTDLGYLGGVHITDGGATGLDVAWDGEALTFELDSFSVVAIGEARIGILYPGTWVEGETVPAQTYRWQLQAEGDRAVWRDEPLEVPVDAAGDSDVRPDFVSSGASVGNIEGALCAEPGLYFPGEVVQRLDGFGTDVVFTAFDERVSDVVCLDGKWIEPTDIGCVDTATFAPATACPDVVDALRFGYDDNTGSFHMFLDERKVEGGVDFWTFQLAVVTAIGELFVELNSDGSTEGFNAGGAPFELAPDQGNPVAEDFGDGSTVTFQLDADGGIALATGDEQADPKTLAGFTVFTDHPNGSTSVLDYQGATLGDLLDSYGIDLGF